ncbi:MAG: adenylyltransferase/cytidyltransferase family protein [Pseudomonadales bacterium]|jgi:D-beta-D-heptose 7-phosphate kinase/D-beta-D-heptose 1-phosphate adenosyltransferase|nr:adenylyltransferase/cytidyltransferase family protein [Pseudomonadales bacterium]
MKKILTYKQLPKVVDGYREQGLEIVLTQGTFDMIHIGHGRYLEEAKEHGDILFVGVDSDKKVQGRKGPERPVVPEDERMEMLTYFTSVDHVALKPLDAPKWSLIKLIRPDILIATAETYNKKQLKELKEYCGKVVVLEPRATTSTSAKLRRIQIKMTEQMTKMMVDKMSSTFEEVLCELKAKPAKKKKVS